MWIKNQTRTRINYFPYFTITWIFWGANNVKSKFFPDFPKSGHPE